MPDIIESVIKSTHIFNDIALAFHPCVIKASPKSDIVMVQINIQNSQNNMNPSVFQYKNCWKQGYTIFICCMHGTKCQKCNGLHKLEHHRDMTWYCKANFKLRLERKKRESCTYSFKCINYKNNHQELSILETQV